MKDFDLDLDIGGILESELVRRVGKYDTFKNLSDDLREYMYVNMLFEDKNGVDALKALAKEFFEDSSSDDPEPAEKVITSLYLYCNWRVFATYKKDKELAKKYQAVCDYIDDNVFDKSGWTEEQKNYFIKETD